jgi:hypothetical protein
VTPHQHLPAHASDIIRLAVVQKMGGIWMDTDCALLKDLRPLIEEFGPLLLTSQHEDLDHEMCSQQLTNGFFIAPNTTHPILQSIIKEVTNALANNPLDCFFPSVENPTYSVCAWTCIGPDSFSDADSKWCQKFPDNLPTIFNRTHTLQLSSTKNHAIQNSRITEFRSLFRANPEEPQTERTELEVFYQTQMKQPYAILSRRYALPIHHADGQFFWNQSRDHIPEHLQLMQDAYVIHWFSQTRTGFINHVRNTTGLNEVFNFTYNKICNHLCSSDDFETIIF